MSVPDPVEIIKALLKADPDVAALAAARVGREIPQGDAAQMPRACVVLRPVGGPGRPGQLRYRRNRIDTICYGATITESWQLHLAVREALETTSRDGALFSVETVSDGSNGRDPSTQWPTCFATYLVLSATST